MQEIKDKQQSILINLNENQTEAVQSITGSTLVIAGAGSGKTAVLTRRVAFLIANGQVPGRILCLTFTNKAAKEMNKRVHTLLSDVGMNLPEIPLWKEDYLQNPLLATFHSLGVRLLREFGSKIDLKKEFSILDSDEQKKTVRSILKELDISEKNVQPSLVLYFISQCKQELLDSSNSRKLNKDFLPIFHQIYSKYEQKLKQSQSVDFDDLLMLPYTILRDNTDVLEILRQRWWHIMIDEFQDTNSAQFNLVKLLCPYALLGKVEKDVFGADCERSLFVVGDDAQSIYAFRGSKIEIILNFEDEYPNTKEIVLNQNYRSTQPILDLAEKILTHNPRQKKKELFTENPETLKVNYYMANNERDEGEYIIRQLYEQYVLPKNASSSDVLENEDVSFQPDANASVDDAVSFSPATKLSNNDPISRMFDVYLEDATFAPSYSLQSYTPESWRVPEYKWPELEDLNKCVVLYRTHAQSRSLEETFLKYHLPYRLVSGVKFLDRKEIKDILSILKFLANGDDKISLSRFLPLIIEGVGPKTLEKILAYLEDFNYPLTPKFQDILFDILQKIQSCWTASTSLIDLTKQLLVVTGYGRYLKGQYPVKEEYEARIENIGELYSLMFVFDEDNTVSMQERLTNFLAQIALMGAVDNDTDENSPKISLMSLHQSKGLEYETVFLVGVEDGLLPHINSFNEAGGMEEEVRLAYVGVTRAKKYLHLISSESRIQFGQIKANPVSRIFRPFLDTHTTRKR
jgi:DNA helicase II / ATP-dependent DNA helicase PcrA